MRNICMYFSLWPYSAHSWLILKLHDRQVLKAWLLTPRCSRCYFHSHVPQNIMTNYFFRVGISKKNTAYCFVVEVNSISDLMWVAFICTYIPCLNWHGMTESLFLYCIWWRRTGAWSTDWQSPTWGALPGVHEVVDSRVEHGVGHRQPVEGEIDVLYVFAVDYALLVVGVDKVHVVGEPADSEHNHNEKEHENDLQEKSPGKWESTGKVQYNMLGMSYCHPTSRLLYDSSYDMLI